jgi:hypothetical protein
MNLNSGFNKEYVWVLGFEGKTSYFLMRLFKKMGA